MAEQKAQRQNLPLAPTHRFQLAPEEMTRTQVHRSVPTPNNACHDGKILWATQLSPDRSPQSKWARAELGGSRVGPGCDRYSELRLPGHRRPTKLPSLPAPSQ